MIVSPKLVKEKGEEEEEETRKGLSREQIHQHYYCFTNTRYDGNDNPNFFILEILLKIIIKNRRRKTR